MHFSLADMVEEYGEDVIVTRETEGRYDDYGKWIDGATETLEVRMILSVNADDTIAYNDSGYLQSNYYKAYTNKKLEKNDKVTHDGKTYTLFDHRDYDSLALPRIYMLKRRDKDELTD